ncbi:MAG: sigma-54-dependent transcriptional regulator, partial [Planctomycetota bacterium]
MARIIVCDDEPSVRELLEVVLVRSGHEPVLAANGREALACFDEKPAELVIHDLKMPGMSGLELLEQLKVRDPNLPVVVITAFSTWDNAVEAMRLGAHDYLKKPFDTNEIREVIERALVRAQLVRRRRGDDSLTVPDLIGDAEGVRQVRDLVRRVAPTESTILIEGESGTGKELVARMVHYLSPRADGPFLAVNCGAFTENLLESELFGHLKGTFTGAIGDKDGLLKVAAGGTFFLDEVGEMPPSTQVKLLRVLQERQVMPIGASRPIRVDLRFICATNRDLAAEVRAGRFRSDLYYRLNVIPIELPPLRERWGDVPLLAGHFVRRYAERIGREVLSIAPDVQRQLEAYPWPGNVRELENVVQRAIALGDGPVLTRVMLPEASRERIAAPPPGVASGAAENSLSAARASAGVRFEAAEGSDKPILRVAPPVLPGPGVDLDQTVSALEGMLIETALRRCEGNLTRAA